MATMDSICNRLFGRASGEAAGSGNSAPTAAAPGSPLRPLPFDEIYLYTKKFDNHRVVRLSDPQAGGTAWRSFAAVGATAVVLIGTLLPHAAGMLAGFQVQQLKQEQDRLLRESRTLDLEISTLLSPERLEKLAASQEYVTPAAQDVIYLEPKSEGSLAMNQKR
jgi:hypothetical protein